MPAFYTESHLYRLTLPQALLPAQQCSCVHDISFQYERILPDPADVLDIQLKKLKEDNALFVLCTCVFYIPDYNSKLIAE